MNMRSESLSSASHRLSWSALDTATIPGAPGGQLERVVSTGISYRTRGAKRPYNPERDPRRGALQDQLKLPPGTSSRTVPWTMRDDRTVAKWTTFELHLRTSAALTRSAWWLCCTMQVSGETTQHFAALTIKVAQLTNEARPRL
jgi:hypothetical protein